MYDAGCDTVSSYVLVLQRVSDDLVDCADLRVRLSVGPYAVQRVVVATGASYVATALMEVRVVLM